MSRLLTIVLAALLVGSAFARVPQTPAADFIAVTDLPPEARQTLLLIKRGGPFPYRQDGKIFGNFERKLPERPRGYYREYTVATPGDRDRGARRIVAGHGEVWEGAPASVYYYTEDHYRSFRKIRE